MQLEAILTTLESIFHVDPDGIAVAINATAANRLGKEPEELLGQNALSFFPAEVLARRARMAEVMQSGISSVFEDSRAGRHYSMNFYPIIGQSGAPESLVVFALDITVDQTKEARSGAPPRRAESHAREQPDRHCQGQGSHHHLGQSGV